MQENSAKEFLLAKNDPTEDILDLVKILNEKMNKSDESVIYYSGGLRAISSICSNDSKRRQFRHN